MLKICVVSILLSCIFSCGNKPEWSHSFSLKTFANMNVEPDPPCQSERWWCPRVCAALHGMALAGFAETAFLTYHKFWGQGADICQEWGCGDILFGPFSQIAGVPLTVPAMLGYGILAYLFFGGVRRTQEYETKGTIILALTTVMATFSCYLMAILFLRLGGEICPYCIASATLSITMFGLLWVFGIVQDKSKAIMTSFTSLSITAFVSACIFFATEATFSPTEMGGSSVTTASTSYHSNPTSGAREMKLAKELQRLGSTMYGTYWCSHCQHQKEILGAEAFSHVKYVEYDNNRIGNKNVINVNKCNGEKGRILQGYPTWEINGQLYPGEKTLEQLEDIVVVQTQQQQRK